MIKIKYIPNILSKENREVKEVDFLRNRSLREYVAEAGFPAAENRVIVEFTNEGNYQFYIKNVP